MLRRVISVAAILGFGLWIPGASPAFAETTCSTICPDGTPWSVTCVGGCGCVSSNKGCTCICVEKSCTGLNSTVSLDVKELPLGDALNLLSLMSETPLDFDVTPPGFIHRKITFSGTDVSILDVVFNVLAQADANPLFVGRDFCRPGGRIGVAANAASISGKKISFPPLEETVSMNFSNIDPRMAMAEISRALDIAMVVPATISSQKLSFESVDEPWLAALDRLAKAAGAKGAKIAPNGIVQIEQ